LEGYRLQVIMHRGQLVSLMIAASRLSLSISAGGPPNSPSFSIVLQTNSTNKSFCLDLLGQKVTPGSKIDIWECTDDIHIFGQSWTFDTGSYRIRTQVNNSKCVAVGASAGSPLVIEDCDSCKNCSFGWDTKGDDKISLVANNVSVGCLVADSVNGSFSNGAVVRVTDCADAQGWFARVGPAPKPYTKDAVFNFKPLGSSLCLSLPPTFADGTLLDLQTCSKNVSKTQEWIFAAGSYRIRSAADPNMCVDALGMTTGTQLALYDCNGFPQQQWAFDSATVSVSLSGSSPPKCMDFGDLKSLKEGAKVVIGNCAAWNLTHTNQTSSGPAILEAVIV
jgi:hypothetical protein